jgi:ribosomal-protein-alanine N-acetyltransferase
MPGVEGPEPHPERGAQPFLSDGVIDLRPWTLDDATVLVAFDHDDKLKRWFDQPDPPNDPSEHMAKEHDVIRRWWREWGDGTSLTFVVRTGGRPVGEVDLRPRSPITANIAYAVAPAHRRKGYATRAVRLLAVEGLTRFGFHRIELMADVDNVASRAVAGKAGFTYEGIRRASGWYEHVPEWIGTPRDDALYSLVEADLLGA